MECGGGGGDELQHHHPGRLISESDGSHPLVSSSMLMLEHFLVFDKTKKNINTTLCIARSSGAKGDAAAAERDVDGVCENVSCIM